VGLTEESEKAILNLNKTGGELVYYTNQWQDEKGNEDQDRISTSILLPSTANPFYYHIDGSEAPYKPHHSLKTDDTTHTVDYHVDCHREVEQRDGETLVKVIHKQGNNGKLVFNAVNIPVEKVWGGGINAEIMNPIQADIYKITETVDESGKIIRNAESVTSLTLSSENGWKATAKGLPKPDGTWYYAVSEAVPSGYIEAYNKQIIQITTDGEHFFDAVVVRDDLVDIPVEKQWGSDIDPEQQEPVEMMIYKVTETKRLVTSGEEDALTLLRYAEPVTTVTLSAENGWKAVAEDLPAPRNNWYYVIAEVMSPGESADYPGQVVEITTDDVSAEELNLSDLNFFQAMMVEAPGDLTTVNNNLAVSLPATGGIGTQWYTLGGLLLMTAAVILWYSCNNKRRKEEHFTS
jgi:LPXTG-motif cell wall-anchored protein